ncbi:RING-H2 finger protein ATL66-like [Rosa rugosa]|uniref:RING-H2 finger protein ATL66-like n=1 Tax=Rosa rugosa TaxID=74645 RepID=UPI002B414ED8|nr:RING-H2 finger protein ATL66-like [Rosa rugosa]
MPTPPPPSSNPLTFQSVIAALCIAPIFFLITEALDHTTCAVLIPFIFLAVCLVVFHAVAIVAQIIGAGRFSSLLLSQTHRRLNYRDQIQIYVYPAVRPGHDDQAWQDGLEKVLPPPTIYSKTQHEGEAHEDEGGVVKSCKRSSSWKQCAICMEDFVEGESCRVLPTCDHIFHLICIDSWLKLHPSCPICRKSICKCTSCVLDV